nr:hypothetical protein [Tanacetum cinerariifolium]
MSMYTFAFSPSQSMPTIHEESPIEEVMALTNKTIKRRQRKKTVQSDENKWYIAWSVEEEISFGFVSEDSIAAKTEDKNMRYKSSGSSSFNTTQSRASSFNLNTEARDDKEEDVQELQRLTNSDNAKKKGWHHRHLQHPAMSN